MGSFEAGCRVYVDLVCRRGSERTFWLSALDSQEMLDLTWQGGYQLNPSSSLLYSSDSPSCDQTRFLLIGSHWQASSAQIKIFLNSVQAFQQIILNGAVLHSTESYLEVTASGGAPEFFSWPYEVGWQHIVGLHVYLLFSRTAASTIFSICI